MPVYLIDLAYFADAFIEFNSILISCGKVFATFIVH